MTNYKNDQILNHIEYSESTYRLGNHFHNAYEIILILEGVVLLHTKNQVYKVGPQNLLFLSNLESHMLEIIEGPYSRYFILVNPYQTDRFIRDFKLLSIFKNRPSTFSHVININSISSQVLKVFQKMYDETQIIDDYFDRRIGMLLFELLLILYRYDSNSFPVLDKNIRPEIYSVQEYIDTHFKEPIVIQQLAQEFFISVSYLTHSFKKLTGYSPKQYLMIQRLIYARDLIVNSELPISEVAYQSGFQDTNNFIRSFKAYFNFTPRKMRLCAQRDNVR